MSLRKNVTSRMSESFRKKVDGLLFEEKMADNVKIADDPEGFEKDSGVISQAAKKIKKDKSGGDFVGVSDGVHLFTLNYDDIDKVNKDGVTPGKGEAIVRTASSEDEEPGYAKINYMKGTIAMAEGGDKLKFGEAKKAKSLQMEKSAFNKIKD